MTAITDPFLRPEVPVAEQVEATAVVATNVTTLFQQSSQISNNAHQTRNTHPISFPAKITKTQVMFTATALITFGVIASFFCPLLSIPFVILFLLYAYFLYKNRDKIE